MKNSVPMKLLQFLAALCLLSVIPAKAAQSGDFTYTATATEVTITGYTGAGGAVVIPASIDGTPVTAIGELAFSPDYQGIQSITSVTIPNSVTSIGDYAFNGCTGLTGVTIGSGVISIGGGAFAGCSFLTSVTIPDNVTSIGADALANCSSLTSVTIGSGVTSIGSYAFYGCSGLISVTIPNSVTSIGEAVFRECTGLTSMTFPNSVTSIGANAFASCSNLVSLWIGRGVTSIGNYAFYGCSGLTHFVFTGNAPTLEPESFLEVPIGATVRYSSAATGWGATFGGLTAVADYLDVLTYSTANNQVTITAYTGTGGVVIIPASIGGAPVTAIGENAFLDSSSLTSVTIPASVTSIGDAAFSECSGLTSLTIPSSVTSIGDSAFFNCSSLTSVTIGSGVTSIGLGAFSGCSGLTSVTIPDNVTSIGANAFASCSGLVSLSIGSGITSIGNEAFAGCSGITRVMIPAATALGIDAFPPTTTILRYLTEAQLTSRDSQQNAAGQASGRTLGREDVTNAPNTYGLYNLSQVQALNVGTPLLAKDSATGKFKLTVKAKKSTDLVNYSDMPFSAEDAVINSNGEMEWKRIFFR